MAVAAAVSLLLQVGPLGWNTDDQREFAYLMIANVAFTTLAWISITLLTGPEPRQKLIAFYERVRPPGPGWKPIRAMMDPEEARPTESLAEQFANWLLGCVLVYSSLFGIGYLIFKDWAWGAGLSLAAVLSAALISRNLTKATARERTLNDTGVAPV